MTGKAGACWLFEPEDKVLEAPGKLVPIDDSVYAETTPIAGVLNPKTKALDSHGEYFYFARQNVWHTRPGALSRYITNGGGGWGDPKTREPERVLADVRNGYVSIEQARAVYGVVITGDPEFDPEGLIFDETQTRTLRQR